MKKNGVQKSHETVPLSFYATCMYMWPGYVGYSFPWPMKRTARNNGELLLDYEIIDLVAHSASNTPP
jgi:predicted transcriptional regulator